MSYTRRNVQVRLIHTSFDPMVMQPFVAASLTVDACAPSSRRFSLQAYADGPEVEYPWYQVLTDEDNARARYAKWSHARAVGRARVALAEAQRVLRMLTS